MKKLLLTLGLAGLLLAGCGGDTETEATTEVPAETEVQTETETEVETEVETEEETEEVASSDYTVTDLAIEEDEFSFYVTGILTNNTDSEKAYVQIQVPVYDSDGHKVGDALDNVNNLAPGQTWKFKAMYFGEKEEGMEADLENYEVTGF